MRQPVTIDFISDVVCPWCALGVTALELAIENLAGEVPVELTFKPFELNPDMPAEGENAVQHLMRKYGRSAEDIAAGKAMQIARGQAIGFTFDLEKRSHFYNTFDAHRLLFWALQEGRQIELKKGLLRAYFSDGQNPSDRETLVRLAAEAGLNAARAREVLASGAFATEVRELEAFYRDHGINSVPAMILNGRHLVSGSQSVEYYEQMLRQMAQAPAEA
ncbi:DsbA family oxidoreductase [Pseudomonas sp. FW306-02-F02-AA]|uniref:Disulfide bond formation protein DsbA n=1 Tax=Pseudomonas fluorescens TaxID=294 RepID=A0A0N9WC48_PSEFL|nr:MULTISPECIES: DsbA family oxidoreductase [Pseudomonas]ALI01757.1 disulfide bond formation protein DsbA [Pseudomonas fluorescens]PMZ05234.1 DsbA family oxidoreductase [Pseudomonas sp. FW306-02-F02-AB]PMZ08641.1 DsbA family oxidoreductase [Pseudomonas sp. FW306-02-H06C]PMZ14559.1 DsbA family oxidoreductase [Pseudomonas sp. FW306-02-F02-AA]PMZ19891.1 DsbA family oxidoreductase [Pseudomonas sp. FW306-02-F08-AA]